MILGEVEEVELLKDDIVDQWEGLCLVFIGLVQLGSLILYLLLLLIILHHQGHARINETESDIHIQQCNSY